MAAELFLCILFFLFILHYIIKKLYFSENKSNPPAKIKTMALLGSGGHTSEMLAVLNNFDFEIFAPLIFVYSSGDVLSRDYTKQNLKIKHGLRFYRIFRARKVGQNWAISLLTTFISLLDSFRILIRDFPDLVLFNAFFENISLFETI